MKIWLKAKIMDGDELFPSEEGTPQGGVISPLLANIALHGLETAITLAFPKNITLNGIEHGRYQPRVIRYADDFVVLHQDLKVVERATSIARKWLSGMGHELKPSKTRITHAFEKYEGHVGFDKRSGREQPWTDKLWIYDLRTNKHFTLKTNPLKYDDLVEFIECYNADNRHEQKETERFKCFTYDELMQRDKVSVDIFWLKDESLEDSANLSAPEIWPRKYLRTYKRRWSNSIASTNRSPTETGRLRRRVRGAAREAALILRA